MKHGTDTGYSWHKCRCDECKEAHRLVAQKRRRAAGMRAVVPAQHGTWGMYVNKKCRCAPCKLAAKEYRLAYHKANPMKESQSRHKRRARLREVLYIPVGTKELQMKFDMYAGCWICKTGPKEVWDHVKPLSKGGAHCLANLRPACWACNSAKKDKWPFKVGINV